LLDGVKVVGKTLAIWNGTLLNAGRSVHKDFAMLEEHPMPVNGRSLFCENAKDFGLLTTEQEMMIDYSLVSGLLTVMQVVLYINHQLVPFEGVNHRARKHIVHQPHSTLEPIRSAP
jgi:hypothetical protein